MLWYPLIVLFPFPQFQGIVHEFAVSSSLFTPASTIVFLVGFAALIFWGLYASRRQRIISFMVIWFYGNLAIEALPLPIDLVHEHRLYLAGLGLICPLVTWMILGMERISRALLPLLLIAAFFGWCTWQRNEAWRTAESLWRDSVSKAPGSSLAWYNYCSGLPVEQKCRQVVPVCSKALAFYPDSSKVENNLGYCYFQTGRMDEAEKHLVAAAALLSGRAANSAEAMEEKSEVYFNIGGLYLKKANYEAAARFYLASLRINPSDSEAHYGLARAYLMMGNTEEYIKELQTALGLKPEWKLLRMELAAALADTGRCDEAFALLKAGRDSEAGREIESKCPNHALKPAE